MDSDLSDSCSSKKEEKRPSGFLRNQKVYDWNWNSNYRSCKENNNYNPDVSIMNKNNNFRIDKFSKTVTLTIVILFNTIAAWMISRGLAYLSTVIHVRYLNFRVRNGNGCNIPALAAIESQDPDLNRSVADLQSAAWPLRHLGLACDKV